MNTKNISFAVVATSLLITAVAVSSASAFTPQNNAQNFERPLMSQSQELKAKRAEQGGLFKKVQKSTEKIANGVVVTITSDDAQVVEKIQSREAQTPQNEEVTVVREKITNGVKLTITSDNPEVVEKIQSREERGNKRAEKRAERAEKLKAIKDRKFVRGSKNSQE